MKEYIAIRDARRYNFCFPSFFNMTIIEMDPDVFA